MVVPVRGQVAGAIGRVFGPHRFLRAFHGGGSAGGGRQSSKVCNVGRGEPQSRRRLESVSAESRERRTVKCFMVACLLLQRVQHARID